MSDFDLATGYVLGTLNGADRESVRIRAIEDQVFARFIESWERRLAPLALSEGVAPPEGLLARIEASILAGAEFIQCGLRRERGFGRI